MRPEGLHSVWVHGTSLLMQAADIRMRGKSSTTGPSQPSWQSVLQSGNITNRSNSAVDDWWNDTDGPSKHDSNQRFYDDWDDVSVLFAALFVAQYNCCALDACVRRSLTMYSSEVQATTTSRRFPDASTKSSRLSF